MKLDVQIKKQQGAFALDVAFTAEAPVVALFGRSGSGKTSVVNAIAGLMQPDSGRIVADGEVLFDAARGINLPPEVRRIGYVFQDGLLFPHMTVRQNLTYGKRATGVARRGAAIDFDAVATLLDLTALLERRPAGLSGGEKQRVAIGRAILSNPRLLLMDEPLASLDAGRRGEILHLIERVRDEMKVSIVYVSHSIGEVTRLADDVVLMNDGRVVAHAPVEEIFNRADLRPHTGRFEGGALIEAVAVRRDEQYFLTTFRFGGVGGADAVDGARDASDAAGELGASAAGDARTAELVTPGLDAAIGSRVRVRIRARDVSLAIRRPEGISMRNVLRGTVQSMEAGEGAIIEVRVRIAGCDIPARISRQARDEMNLQTGQTVYALIKAIAFDKRSMGFTA